MKPTDTARLAMAGFTFALCTIGSGCATRYEVKIDATSRVDLRTHGGTSFQIRNKHGGPDADTLRFKEAANHIRTALSGHGLYETPGSKPADIIVEIDYGFGSTRVAFLEFQTPVFGRLSSEPGPRRPPSLDSPNELVGYEDAYLPVTLREKHLSVCGYENTPRTSANPPRELWRVDVSIEDESTDLRGYLPLLASAAMDRIGRNSDGMTTLRPDDETVRFIQKGM